MPSQHQQRSLPSSSVSAGPSRHPDLPNTMLDVPVQGRPHPPATNYSEAEHEEILIEAHRSGGLRCLWWNQEVERATGAVRTWDCGAVLQNWRLFALHLEKKHCKPLPAPEGLKRGTASRPAKRYRCQWANCMGHAYGTPEELLEHIEDVHTFHLLYPCIFPDCTIRPSRLPAALRHLREHLKRGDQPPFHPLYNPSSPRPIPELPAFVHRWDVAATVQIFPRWVPPPIPALYLPLPAETIDESEESDAEQAGEGMKGAEVPAQGTTGPRQTTGPQTHLANPYAASTNPTLISPGFPPQPALTDLRGVLLPPDYWTRSRTGPSASRQSQEEHAFASRLDDLVSRAAVQYDPDQLPPRRPFTPPNPPPPPPNTPTSPDRKGKAAVSARARSDPSTRTAAAPVHHTPGPSRIHAGDDINMDRGSLP